MKNLAIIILMGIHLVPALQSEIDTKDVVDVCADDTGIGEIVQPKVQKFLERKKIYRDDRRLDNLRLQNYIHRSIASGNYAEDPWARRYSYPKYNIIRTIPAGELSKSTWYEKNDYSKNDQRFENSRWLLPPRKSLARVMDGREVSRETEMPKDMVPLDVGNTNSKVSRVNYTSSEIFDAKYAEPASEIGSTDGESVNEDILANRSSDDDLDTAETLKLKLDEIGMKKLGKEFSAIEANGVEASEALIKSIATDDGDDSSSATSNVDIKKSRSKERRKKGKRKRIKKKYYTKKPDSDIDASDDRVINVNANRNVARHKVRLEDFKGNLKLEGKGENESSMQGPYPKETTGFPKLVSRVTSRNNNNTVGDTKDEEEDQSKILIQSGFGIESITDAVIDPSKFKGKYETLDSNKSSKHPSKTKPEGEKSSENNSASNNESGENGEQVLRRRKEFSKGEKISEPKKPATQIPDLLIKSHVSKPDNTNPYFSKPLLSGQEYGPGFEIVSEPNSDLGQSSVYRYILGDARNGLNMPAVKYTDDYEEGSTIRNINRNVNTNNNDYELAPISQSALSRIVEQILGIRSEYGRRYIDRNVRRLINTRRRSHLPRFDADYIDW